ncbi:MFS transporter [Brachybacterium subflavum]|uniref:MFS transporter n=1 Tax=Brachybacterium subflavum TaxID=2585206 RepID=UPI001266526B|nr:MFS transporter [Brachybacterium subflavum]
MTAPAVARRPARSRPTRKRLGIFAILWLLVLLNYVDRSTLSIALPYMSEDLSISPALQGWILSLFFWTYLVFQIPGGWLLDRFGPRRVVSAAGALWGLLQASIGLMTSGLGLGVARLGLGAFEAPTAPSGSKLNSEWLPASERARGATFIDMAGAFGSAIGGVLVTGIIGVLGSWRWAFVVTGLLTVVLAVVYFIYVRDTPEEHSGVDEGELRHIRQRGSAESAEAAGADGSSAAVPEVVSPDAPLPRLTDYARSASWWGFWLGRLGWATVWWGIISWTPSYLADARGFDLLSLGGATFAVFGMGVVGQLVAGALADWGRARFGSYNRVMKTILVGSGLAMVVTVFLIPTVSSSLACLVMLALAVFFTNFGGLYWAIPAWLAPPAQVGKVGSVMNMASSLGGALAPVAMGYAIGAADGSYAGAFLFLGLAAALYLIGSAVINFGRPLAVAGSR